MGQTVYFMSAWAITGIAPFIHPWISNSTVFFCQRFSCVGDSRPSRYGVIKLLKTELEEREFEHSQ